MTDYLEPEPVREPAPPNRAGYVWADEIPRQLTREEVARLHRERRTGDIVKAHRDGACDELLGRL